MNRPTASSQPSPGAQTTPDKFGWDSGIFSRSPGIVAQLAADGTVHAANHTAAAGRPFDELFLPEARATISQALARVGAENAAVQVEAAALNADGSQGWKLVLLSPITRDGQFAGIIAQTVDISERHREEERLRHSEVMMVDTQGVAHLGVWEWDITQPHAVWSPELYRTYGLDPANHVPTYPDYLTRVHPDDRQRVIDATNSAFHDLKAYSHDERIYRPDGSLRYLHTWAYPVLDQAGKLVRLTGVCQDITDRALAENAVAEHAELLTRANAELEQFARLAAHDLQEPLRTVASFVQILAMRQEGRLDAESKEAMDFVLQGVQRMKAQIGDLLKYVKTTSPHALTTPVELDDSLERVRSELHAAITDSGAVIHSAPLPAVFAEPTQVDAVLRNLISNAIKFRGPEKPQIEISAVPAAGTVEVVVKDNGIGIAEKYQERIFVVFQRLNPDTAGTGIGLAVCKKIVDRNGGRIWVESEPGQGAAFHFTLPAARAA